MRKKYDDIINQEHHVSKKHPPMSMYNRAAQFAPFAALTGYEDSIRDTTQKNQEAFSFVPNEQIYEDLTFETDNPTLM